MARYLALAYAALCSACTSPAMTAMPDTSGAPSAQPLAVQDVGLSDDGGMKNTVPKVMQDQKDGPIDTLARTLHVYWFFGSR
jgi:hypothetical protein